jgi:hypothetical protein
VSGDVRRGDLEETGDSRQQTADNRQQTADSRQQTADSRQQTADSRQQAADSRPLTSFLLAGFFLPFLLPEPILLAICARPAETKTP